MEEVNKTGGSVLRVFGEERQFWRFSAILFTVISFLKGLRAPNNWAATQAQVGYSQGFVKRGLFGATVSHFLGLQHYARFTLVSTILLLTLFAIGVLFTQRAGIGDRFGNLMPLAVFGASPVVMYLAHLNGYLEIPLAILTLLWLLVRPVWARFLLAIPVVVTAILIHELFLFVFLPVLLLAFLLQASTGNSAIRRRWASAGFVSITLLALAVTLSVGLRASATADTVRRLKTEVVAKSDFPVRNDFFDVVTRSMGDNVKTMIAFPKHSPWWLLQCACVLTFVPSIAFLLLLTRKVIGTSVHRMPRWAFPACVLASASPLLLNAFGWDIGRWYALSGLATFLVLGVVCWYVPQRSVVLSRAMERAAIVVIALGMAAGGTLMDKMHATPYPFVAVGLSRIMQPAVDTEPAVDGSSRPSAGDHKQRLDCR